MRAEQNVDCGALSRQSSCVTLRWLCMEVSDWDAARLDAPCPPLLGP